MDHSFFNPKRAGRERVKSFPAIALMVVTKCGHQNFNFEVDDLLADRHGTSLGLILAS